MCGVFETVSSTFKERARIRRKGGREGGREEGVCYLTRGSADIEDKEWKE